MYTAIIESMNFKDLVPHLHLVK